MPEAEQKMLDIIKPACYIMQHDWLVIFFDLNGGFSAEKKTINLVTLARAELMALEKVPEGSIPLKPLFFSIVSVRKNQSRCCWATRLRQNFGGPGEGGDFFMRSAVETTDLFRGAFFLCNGGTLAEVRLEGNGHRIVSFLIEGEGIDQVAP